MKIVVSNHLQKHAQTWLHGIDLQPMDHSIFSSYVEEMSRGVMDGFIWPLHELPLASEREIWIPAALSPRFASELSIHGAQWQQGKLWWLPERTTLKTIHPTTAHQVQSQRSDLHLSDSAKFEETPFWNELKDVKRIHPFELVPPAGYGVLVLVTTAENKNLRDWAIHYHHQDVGICTNIERMWQAENEEEHRAAHVERDEQGRFHFYFTFGQGEACRKEHLCHNSWGGLLNAARKFAQ